MSLKRLVPNRLREGKWGHDHIRFIEKRPAQYSKKRTRIKRAAVSQKSQQLQRRLRDQFFNLARRAILLALPPRELGPVCLAFLARQRLQAARRTRPGPVRRRRMRGICYGAWYKNSRAWSGVTPQVGIWLKRTQIEKSEEEVWISFLSSILFGRKQFRISRQ